VDLAVAPRGLAHALPAPQPAGKLNPEYREIVDATVELLHATKAQLRTPDVALAAVSRELWRGWRETWIEAAQCLPEIVSAPGQLQLAKAYTESHLTPELMGAPLWRQAYAKPLGYPGDYVVMEHIYAGGAARTSCAMRSPRPSRGTTAGSIASSRASAAVRRGK
jgi:hypothetical protein